MARRTLNETLTALQEIDFMAGPGMIDRPDYSTGVRDPRNAPKNFKPMRSGDDYPYDGSAVTELAGPWNAQGMGPQGIGRGGVGLGGAPNVSGEYEPRLQGTWDGGPEGVDESPDLPHGERRNLWRDTIEADDLRKKVKNQLDTETSWEMDESQGSPTQIGLVAPMDGLSVGSSGRDAKPVKDVDGDDVSPEHVPPPVDPMLGVGTMWGRGGNPGTNKGWANAPANMKREKSTMRLREFFDPNPVEMEEVDNPEQDKLGDSTDDEIEVGDQEAGAEPDETGDDGQIEDLIGQLAGMGDSEPGDGDDLGSPENVVLMPHAGHGTDFTMSPDKMGAARGTFGMQADGAGGTTTKSSAWDVLQKVVNALGEEEDEVNPGIQDELC